MALTARADFWKFFAGQALSVLGSAFSMYAIPLLVYQITGSATELSISFAAAMLSYLLFGLTCGAIADRSARKRLLIGSDLGRAAVFASISLLYYPKRLPLWWIHATSFMPTVLRILFDAEEFAAIPSLVPLDDLVRANRRIQAVYSAGFIAGPPLAGLATADVPVVVVLWIDSLMFVISTALPMWICT